MYGKKYIKLNTYNISVFLFSLLPILIVTGPALPDLVLLILIIIFFFQKFKIEKKIYFYYFLLFYIYLNIRSFFSTDIIFSLKSTIPYFRFGLLIIVTSFLFKNLDFFFKILLYFLIFIFSILIIDGYFQFFFGQNIIGIKQFDPSRVSSFFLGKLVLGSYLVRLLPILCALIFYTNNKEYIKFIPLIILLTGVLILFSGEKAALGLFIIEVFVIFVIFCYQQGKKYFLLIIPITIFMFLILYSSALLKKRLITDAISNSGYGNYIFSRVHDSHFKTAFKMFLDNPLFGKGPNTFRLLCDEKKYNINEFSCSTHPHNTYIQLLAETGLIGFCFVAFFFVYIFINLLKVFINILKKRKINPVESFLCLSVFVNLFPIATTGNFFNNWTSIIYYFSFSLYLNYLRLKSK
jgi:O-antigen ligase